MITRQRRIVGSVVIWTVAKKKNNKGWTCSWAIEHLASVHDLIHISTANRHMGLCAFISILFCLHPRIPVCLIHAIPDCPCVDIWWSTHEQTALFFIFVCLLASDRFSLWLAWTCCVVEAGLEFKAIYESSCPPLFFIWTMVSATVYLIISWQRCDILQAHCYISHLPRGHAEQY